MAARTALSSGGCVYFTYTKVPPRNSTPQLMPCQKIIESTPATLKQRENAMKYHFLPRKSMFGFLKNSTLLKPFFVHVATGALTRPARRSRACLYAGHSKNVEPVSDRTGEGAPVPRGQSKYSMLRRLACGSAPNQKSLATQTPR